jgi:bacterial microcompartment shell protein
MVAPPPGPALGILETSSIARGIVAADAALKRSPALLLHSRPVSGGKQLVIFRGGVAEVEEAMIAGRAAAAALLLDAVELPMADAQVWPMVESLGQAPWGASAVLHQGWERDPSAESIAIVETRTVSAAIAAADAAVKVADVTLCDVRLAEGISGKGFFTLVGSLVSIQAAADAARDAAHDRLVVVEVIAQPVVEIRGRIVF